MTALIQSLSAFNGWRLGIKNSSIALVPTMGSIHAGHLALVQQAKKEADHVVVSLFVNPLQFGVGEDYDAYPRALKADLAQLEGCQVDAVFAPRVSEMTPNPLLQTTHIQPQADLGDVLEGRRRPGHFAGVLTIVAKLFHLVRPTIALFGEKDYQQLTLIRTMVRDLHFPIKIVACPTVREASGLALSSRNRYLDAAQKVRAAHLYATLFRLADAIRQAVQAGESLLVSDWEEKGTSWLLDGSLRVDYLAIRRSQQSCDDLACFDHNLTLPLHLLAAVWVDQVRLIDQYSLLV